VALPHRGNTQAHFRSFAMSGSNKCLDKAPGLCYTILDRKLLTEMTKLCCLKDVSAGAGAGQMEQRT